MQVKFPPLINVEAEFGGTELYGSETVVLTLRLGAKVATITMSREEASRLMGSLKNSGITPPVSLGAVILKK